MATLQKIRNKGPLVAIIIGLALVAFILGDLVRSGNSIFSNERFQIAEINGESIDYRDLERKLEENLNIYKIRSGQAPNDELREQMRSGIWEQMVQEQVIGKEYAKLGLGVSSDELYDMCTGRNVDPMIRQSFTDPQTGQFNPGAVVQFLKSMDQDQSGNSKAIWLYMENELSTKRAFQKYISLVGKGLYVTNQQAKNEFIERSYLVDFNWVGLKYSSINDNDVKVTDNELKDYYNQHIKEYKQEESRGIAYVTFDVTPSNDDRIDAEKWINQKKEEFQSTTENKQFVNANSDIRFDEKHYKKGEFANKEVDSIMFKAKIGYIHGPFIEDNAYKLIKLTEIKDLSDSVKVRHILVQPDGKKIVDMKQAHHVADSIKDVIIKKKGDFKKLAETFSADQASVKEGGDLKWFTEGKMVQPFGDSCFFAKKGRIFTVETQFGVHIVEVLDKSKEVKKIQLAILQRKIEPSQRTYQIKYAEASKFGAANTTREAFEAAIKSQNLQRKVAPNLSSIEKVIAGLENPRELVRWAYRAKQNEISQIFEFGNKYVIAVLTDIREKGTAQFEQIKPQIEYLVKQDKKAQILIDKMKSETNLDAIAQKNNVKVEEAKNISFTSFQIPNAGFEPEVIATASVLPKDKVSAPIKGKTGVYMIVVTSITPAPSDIKNINLAGDKQRLGQGLMSRASYQVYETLKESANIVDKRAKFF